MLPTKFQVKGCFGSEEAKNSFSRWPPQQPSWISNQNSFSYFCSTSHPDASYQVSSQLDFQFRRRSQIQIFKKAAIIVFQDGHHSNHLGFPIRTILAIYDLQVTRMVPTKFQVNWPFSSGEEAKNRFSRWPPWRPSWISNRNNFSYF